MKNRLLAFVAALAVALGVIVAGVAGPASAHESTCNGGGSLGSTGIHVIESSNTFSAGDGWIVRGATNFVPVGNNAVTCGVVSGWHSNRCAQYRLAIVNGPGAGTFTTWTTICFSEQTMFAHPIGTGQAVQIQQKDDGLPRGDFYIFCNCLPN
jgi:hypothetical protein